jgi:protein TonB
MPRNPPPRRGRPDFAARRRPHWAGITMVVVLHVAVLLALVTGTRSPAAHAPERMTVSVSLAPPAAPIPTPAIEPPRVRRTARPAPQPAVPSPLLDAPVGAAAPTESIEKPRHDAAAAPSAATVPAAPASTPMPKVTPPRSDAAHLNNPVPAYPTASRRFGEQGHVLLEVFILADGSVGEIRLKRSSGFMRLDEAALDAVRRWRFVPARRGEQAIAQWHVQPITFSLDT